MDLLTIAILIPLLPFVAAVLIGAVGLQWVRSQSHWIALAGVGGSLALSILLFSQIRGVHGDEQAALIAPLELYKWFGPGGLGDVVFNMEFRIDQITCMMLLTVYSVATMVVVYSVGYMRDHHGHPERGYERFFAFLCIFVFSMSMLVLAGNFLLLFMGWELVGLSSYLLIGFYYHKPEAAAAAKKAFIVNRVGDFGFGLGIFLIYYTFGTLEYSRVFEMVSAGTTYGGGPLDETRITAIAMLLFCGAMGKSAQFPLHVWLPDAMEGPTPVSALIHAATMVTAGIYMVARCHVIFVASETAMAVVAAVGAFTAIFAATIALTQFDMKRILAFSTLSQLGYMFLGLGVNAMPSAMFHLFTHAFFKALLFLGAGSVMHAMNGVIDIRRFGGLRKHLPWTWLTFLIGSLALAGVPGLAGFFSKDEIVHAAWVHSPLLGTIATLTAVLTAFYTFRMFFVAFHGQEKLPQGVDHPHESGIWMLTPLFLLSIGAVGAGYLGMPTGNTFHHFLEPVLAAEHHAEGAMKLMIISGVLALVGIGAAWFVYLRKPQIAAIAAHRASGLYHWFYNKYYIDEFYEAVIVGPLWTMGRFCFGSDSYLINSILRFIRGIPEVIGLIFKSFQRGAMQGYAMGMSFGLLILVLWLIWANGAV